MNISQLRDLIIEPVLTYLGINPQNKQAAIALLLGTAIQESQAGHYIKQLGQGPALGIYQMEPATHDDIWLNYLIYQPVLRESVNKLLGIWPAKLTQLKFNLAYSTAMCRIYYLRVKEPLPDPADLVGQATYWKKYYNTTLGSGTIEQYITAYKTYIAS